MPFVFIHPLDEPLEARTDASAAFGDGVAPRRYLLQHLSMHDGLVPLRAANKATRELCRESEFEQRQHGLPSAGAECDVILSFCKAFPLAAGRLEITVDRQWTMEHIETLPQGTKLNVTLDSDAFEDLGVVLKVLGHSCRVLKKFIGLADLSQDEAAHLLQHVEELWVSNADEMQLLGKWGTFDNALPKLHTVVMQLTDDEFGDDDNDNPNFTYDDFDNLNPFASRLRKLRIESSGVELLDMDYNQFSQLRSLHLHSSSGSLGVYSAESLPASLEQLRKGAG